MSTDNNHRTIVRVSSKKDKSGDDEPSSTSVDKVQKKKSIVTSVDTEDQVDPYTIKRRESLQNNIYDIYGKVMLLGDSGVGKTCILMRFREGTFLSGNFISTVGVDFRTKVVTVDNTKVKLQIWDTAGQERFRSVTHAYYRDAHALLLLYDVTNKTSFDNIRAWLGEIREYAQDDVVIMLLGNKADCGIERAVRREDGERLAREYNVAFMETSAKSGQNVELAFVAVARELKYRENGTRDSNTFNVNDYIREQSVKPQCPPCTT
uniref:small monomeric GTPase n=1 Tax=Diabrotica virgifera virgifera TaxID=50390 RepID=A0A6P7FRQ5_DIAVI